MSRTASSRRLKALYAVVRDVVASSDSYLQLSLNRLIDGTRRERTDDAVIDLVIRLENLLLGGSSQELSYKFGMYGAFLLGDDIESRMRWKKDMRELYKVRSQIVHGLRVNRSKTEQFRLPAQTALRKIWRRFADAYLAAKVRHVAAEEGDGAGFDVESWTPTG